MKNSTADEFFEISQEEIKEPKEKIAVVSFSQYSMWMNCPHQWKLNYIDGHYRFDQSIDTVFGTAMHNTIQEWLPDHFQDMKKAKRIDLGPILKDHLIKEFKSSIQEVDGEKVYICDAQTLQEYYDDGCAILDHVQKYGKDFFPTKEYKLIGCELKLTVPLKEKLNFRAYLDIVIHDTKLNEYHIVDLKTSRMGWYEAQKKDPKKLHQILLYKNFFSEDRGLTDDQIKAKFLILKRKIKENPDFIIRRLSKFEPSQGTVSMNKMKKSWNQFITECFDEEGNKIADNIKPTPSEKSCRYCVFKNDEKLCPDSYYLQRKKAKNRNKKLTASK